MEHWAQCVREKRPHTLPAFDYGTTCGAASKRHGPIKCNQDAYDGAKKPPAYDLAAVDTPLLLFSGGADKLADPADVAALKKQLGLDVVTQQVKVPGFQHLDFMWGDQA